MKLVQGFEKACSSEGKDKNKTSAAAGRVGLEMISNSESALLEEEEDDDDDEDDEDVGAVEGGRGSCLYSKRSPKSETKVPSSPKTCE